MSLHGSIYPNPSVQFTTGGGGTPPEPRDLAPGLTMQDIDAMLREHYAKGYRDGQREGMNRAGEIIASERTTTAKKAAKKAEADLLQWMWPNVLSRVLSASERLAAVLDAPKSTIDNDRKSVKVAFDQLKSSLHTFHGKRPGGA